MLIGIVFPCSSTVTLEMLESTHLIKDVVLIGVNSHENYETSNLFNKTFNNCPSINTDEEECINYLLNIALVHKCDFILPTMDFSHFILSKYIRMFQEKNICIITSPYETNQICISKKKTYTRFKDIVECPIMYNYLDIIVNKEKYATTSLYLKPDIGYGSRHCYLAKGFNEVQKYMDMDKINEFLILEYLPNDEYTIDCFTSNRKLMYIHIRKRTLYKNGLSVITEKIDPTLHQKSIIEDYAYRINDEMEFVGAWFFQVKFNTEQICKLLEISTRIAGASSINRLNGCNLTLLSIYHHFKYPIEIIKNDYPLVVSKILKNHVNLNATMSYMNVYVDFDDTLIVNNQVNYLAMAFLYKSLNEKKNVYLITRHKKDIYHSLSIHNIPKNIFKEIVHLTDGSKKSIHVKEHSLFIDDSFQERKDVSLHVPHVMCFDVDFFEYIFL